MFKRILTGLGLLTLLFVGYLYFQAGRSGGDGYPDSPLATTTDAMSYELRPCPGTPNCVSTVEPNDARRDPIPYTGPQADAQRKLLRVLDELPRTKRVKVDGNYVHYTFTTWPIPFTDDVEFLFDDDGKVIHYRSASRVGKSDLGVNAKRMAKIVAAYAQ